MQRGRVTRRFSLLWQVLLVALVAGCASILGVDKDYEEVPGGPDSGGPGVGDGTTGNDGGGDANADDSGNAGDGGADAPFDGMPYVPLANDDVRVYYARTNGEVAFRTWAIASQTWSAPTIVATFPQASVSWVRPIIRGGVEALGVMDVSGAGDSTMRIYGTVPGWSEAITAPNVQPSARSTHRGFDLAMSAQSGHTMVVYADGTPTPKFRVQKGGSWSAAAPVAVAPGIATVDWIALESHPTTDEVALVYADTARRLFASVWDGTTWSTISTLDTTGINPGEYQGFDLAYENLSGDLLVVWARTSSCSGPNDPVYYATKSAGSTTFNVTTAPQMLGAFGPITLASEPGTNKIGFQAVEMVACCTTGCNDLGAGMWDGTAWLAMVDHNGTTNYVWNERPGATPSAFGWLGTTGQAFGTYVDPLQTDKLPHQRWLGAGGFGSGLQADFTITPTAKRASFAMTKTGGSTLALFILDTNGNLWAKRFNGTTLVDMNNDTAIAIDVRVNLGTGIGAVSR